MKKLSVAVLPESNNKVVCIVITLRYLCSFTSFCCVCSSRIGDVDDLPDMRVDASSPGPRVTFNIQDTVNLFLKTSYVSHTLDKTGSCETWTYFRLVCSWHICSNQSYGFVLFYVYVVHFWRPSSHLPFLCVCHFNCSPYSVRFTCCVWCHGSRRVTIFLFLSSFLIFLFNWR